MRGVYNDMHRIGLRRILPLIFTLVHIVLVWFALAHQSRASANVSSDSEYRYVAYQEGSGVPMKTLEPSQLKPVQKIALILNLPAMFLAAVIAAVLFPLNDRALMYISIAFVPLVWYVIGKWLDGILGYCERLRLPGPLRGLLALPAVGILCVSMAGLTPLYHHRTANTYWVFIGLLIWSGLCIAIMLSSSARRNE
jgi:hypothetical protein